MAICPNCGRPIANHSVRKSRKPRRADVCRLSQQQATDLRWKSHPQRVTTGEPYDVHHDYTKRPGHISRGERVA